MEHPTREQIYTALVELTIWATGPNRSGNPYCIDAVKKACFVIAHERGLDSWTKWNEVDTRPEYRPTGKKTRKAFESFLDDNAPQPDSEFWVIGGRRRRGRYGAAIRRHDPIWFNVGYTEWKGNA